MAEETSDGEALEKEAMVEECFEGFCCLEIDEVLSWANVRFEFGTLRYGQLTSLPPITSGTSSGVFFWKLSRAAVRPSR